MRIREMKNYNFLKNHIIYEYLDTVVPLGVDPIIVGYERCTSEKETVHLHKTHYVLQYVFKGKGYFSVEDKTYTVEKDTLLFFPTEKISYVPDKEDPWEYIWIEFLGVKCPDFLSRCKLSAKNPLFRPENPQIFFTLFADMMENCVCEKNRKNYQILCASSLIRLFYLIIRQQNENDLSLNSEKKKSLSIAQYIETHYTDPDFSLKEVGKNFYFSLPYLSRIFKKEIGVSPSQYVIQLRINKAKKMLQSKQFKIANVAFACGYSSPYYFSLDFKRIVGMSPSKYKQMEVHIE